MIQPVIDYFKCEYARSVQSVTNILADNNWSPYQSRKFITPVSLVHHNPLSNENHPNVMMDDNLCTSDDSEINLQEFWMIFKSSSSTFNAVPKTLLINGAPGMGKTVIAEEIAYRWAENMMLRNVQLLLLVYLRNVDIQKITNFEELVQYYYADKHTASNCAKHFISNKGKNLMIMFDGFDEMAVDKQRKNDTFFMNLLLRKILPDCYLVITSRPYITSHIHQYCDCKVELLGIDKADRLSYLQESLSSEKFKLVTEIFQSSSIIDNLCYIPINLMNFLPLVEYNDKQFPITQTELTAYAIRLTIANNKRRFSNESLHVSFFQDTEIDNIIVAIAPFAHEMLEREQLVFSETEMKSAGIYMNHNDNYYGLLKAMQLNSLQNMQHKSFVHPSVQEYLTAYYLSKHSDIAQKFALHHKFWDGRYFAMWKMYVGLTKGDSFPLKAFLSAETTDTHHLLGYTFPGISEELKMSKVRCLQLFEILLEAPDSKMKESLSSVVNTDLINLSNENLSVTEVDIISHYIVRSHVTMEWQMINLSHCNIDDARLELLYQLSNLEDGRAKPSIKCLNISHNKICKLSTLFCLVSAYNISRLLASNNMCKDNDYVHKGQKFGSLKVLDLSSNQLENKDAVGVCTALCMHQNLRELNINDNYVDENITKHLMASILHWDNFEKLEYIGNRFRDYKNSFKLIQFAMQRAKFHGKTINFAKEFDHIGYFLSLLECISDISLHQCNFAATIFKVTELSLDCRNNPEKSMQPTLTVKASQSFKLFANLVTLNISGLHISDDVADTLIVAFNSTLLSLQNLVMNNCSLNSKIVMKLMNKLKCAKYINTVEMKDNCIDDDATKALVTALLHWNVQSINKLNLENNPIDLKIFQFMDSLLVQSVEDLSIDLSDNLEDVVYCTTLLECMNNISPNASAFVSILMKVHTLNLECLQGDHTGNPITLNLQMSQSLKCFNNLTVFNISGIVINEESVDVLSDVFATYSSSLQRLIMNKCGLDSKSTIKLLQNLHDAKSLKEIKLCDNFIDDEATEEVIIAILHWNCLKVIKLERNQFNEESISTIQFLLSYLNYNEVLNRGVLNLGQTFKNSTCFINLLHCMSKVNTKSSNFVSLIITLTELNIGLYLFLGKHVELTVEGSLFFQRFVNLTKLNINCIALNESSTDKLAVAFGSNLLSLKHLYMSGCRITSKTSIKILEQLQKNRNIEILDLSHNLIGDKATKALITSMFQWKYMLVPNLNENKFSFTTIGYLQLLMSLRDASSTKYYDSEYFIAILEYAQGVPVLESSILETISKLQDLFLISPSENKIKLTVHASDFFLRFVNLTSLTIENITVPRNSMNVLAEAFASNLRCLKQLSLNNCGITSEVAIFLMDTLRNSVDLEVLQLRNNKIDDQATKIIVATIFCWHSLKKLNLDNNQFSFENILFFYFINTLLDFSSVTLDFSHDLNKVNFLITLLDYAKDAPLNFISKVEYLCLDCFDKQITDKQLELTANAAKSFQKFTNLVKLNISGIIVNKQTSNALAIAFGSNLRTLECLVMNGCNLTSAIVRKLIKALQNAKNIKEIQLCDNLMCENVIEALAIAIFNWEALEILKLDNNDFYSDDEIRSLFFMLMGKESLLLTQVENITDTKWRNFYVVKSFISILDYASNHTGTQVSHFTKVIAKFTALNLNSIYVNKPRDFNLDLSVGAANFFSNLANIAYLNLSGIIISEETVNVLCKQFDFSKLQSLQMNNCRLTSSCIVNLLDKLKWVNIKVLEIEDNSIDDNATKALMVAMLHWGTPCAIALKRNYFSQKFYDVFRFVVDFLQSSQSILSFSGNLNDTTLFITLMEYMKEVSVKHSTVLKKFSEAKDLYFCNSDKIYLCSDRHNVQEESVNQLTESTQLELSPDASYYFQIFHNLTKLIIDGITMNEITADNVLRTFSNNSHTLQHITLNRCSINSKIAIKFAGELQKAANVTEFHLHNNVIDDEATEALVTMILHWNSLSIIEISKNHFSDKSMNLFLFVKKSCLTDKSNSIDCKHKDSASMLALLGIMENVSTTKSKLVKSITSVNQLALNCSGDEQQMTMHTSLFFIRFTNLKELSLSGIPIDTKSMDIIASALVSNLYGTLESLMFNSCHLSSVSVAIVFASVNKSKIRSLCLSNNEITNEVTGAINKFLDNNTILQFISLANNHFTTEIFLNIKENMLRCISLQYIDISNNQITDDAAKDLAHMSSHFKSLKVDGNQLSENTLKQFTTWF